MWALFCVWLVSCNDVSSCQKKKVFETNDYVGIIIELTSNVFDNVNVRTQNRNFGFPLILR